MTLATTLTRAAELLEETAQCLKESNAVAKDKADHDEMLRLALVLRIEARSKGKKR